MNKEIIINETRLTIKMVHSHTQVSVMDLIEATNEAIRAAEPGFKDIWFQDVRRAQCDCGSLCDVYSFTVIPKIIGFSCDTIKIIKKV